VFTTDSFMGSPPQLHLVDCDLKVRLVLYGQNNMLLTCAVTVTSAAVSTVLWCK
jgi:hypothetical protein